LAGKRDDSPAAVLRRLIEAASAAARGKTEDVYALRLLERATDPKATAAQRKAASSELSKRGAEAMRRHGLHPEGASVAPLGRRSARVTGSVRHTNDDRWLAMHESGASSMKSYKAWTEAQPRYAKLSNGKPIPSWKSIERQFLPQAKPGETAWEAAERLGRKAGKL
jgi:hypothetical protein